ncbi:hypothetical protein FSP39_017459 [Pinctada imbricata]|uniref:DDE Tnp4 domain-containing protein n=1 Tax=Pinctada imbricata TaxID=66713 RepID=A0AA89C606_PINIB|nr:hypothetical protein FSP39_017459 [Pinctada imbricata]
MEIEHKQSLGLHLNLQKKRSEMPKVNNYMRVIDDMTFMYQNIDDFKLHYRLHRDTFDIVLNEVFIWLHIAYRGGSLPIEPDKQFLVFLNYLGNQQSMRECAHLFGLSKSTVHRVIHSVTSALLQIKDKVIRWPNGEEQKEIARKVQNCGIPGVVGFIDGTHIRLASAPGGDRKFLQQKGLSVNATAESGRSFIQDHQLLADNAYPLRNWLISPYKKYGNLTLQQHRFNKKLSSARQTIERAFGHLKGRFRRLKEATLHDPKDVTQLIMAACILHNFCVINTEELDEFMDSSENDPNACQNVYLNGANGVARRMRLLQLV